MCGIAGMVDLEGRRPVPVGVLQAMADALSHRGPDEDGFLDRARPRPRHPPAEHRRPRRRPAAHLQRGRQRLGRLQRRALRLPREDGASSKARGHRFRTHCDTELIPHLWEDHGEGMFDAPARAVRRRAVGQQAGSDCSLGRDRFGICPLFWTVGDGDDWLLFASEIKAPARLGHGRGQARPARASTTSSPSSPCPGR